MKVLKIILLVIVALIIILLIIALFVRKDYAVERTVTINKPKQQVFDYIKYVKNQDNYSKWNKIDPAMKKSYQGTDGTPGFVYSWDSEKKEAGKGEQSIKKVTEGERIDLGLHFIKPFEGLADAYMTTTAVGDNQTKVTWGFNSKMKYPFNAMLLFMNMEKMVGDDLQEGLDNLKVLMEK